jgi:hypothetical protein
MFGSGNVHGIFVNKKQGHFKAPLIGLSSPPVSPHQPFSRARYPPHPSLPRGGGAVTISFPASQMLLPTSGPWR